MAQGGVCKGRNNFDGCTTRAAFAACVEARPSAPATGPLLTVSEEPVVRCPTPRATAFFGVWAKLQVREPLLA
jgi:hypothetical protein